MDTQEQILGLLHDTILEKIQYRDNTLDLQFVFYVDDIEYKIDFQSKGISKISCFAHDIGGDKIELNVTQLKEPLCSYIRINKKNVELLLEEDLDTVIELKYNSTKNKISGNIEKLKEFWDIPAA